ncbi:hypothetical protein LTS03_010828 [Exophiala xenobiotica]|nr:hypothetical protein LTR61_011392 [Exophiala xenobiotica]KAK5360000.1 hypothetical protein LTS03_010828 [Exophiala xenobiotica]KAK5433214.1 hypothetical protein LTR18_011008 [Exophiala xenobiotica]
MASMDALCSSSINPAILDLSRGIEQDLELADTGHAVDGSDSSLSDNSSVVDEEAGLEGECSSSEHENTESVITAQRATLRTQSRPHVQKKAQAREKTSIRLHKRRRSTATKHMDTRKSVHVETLGRLIKVAATAEAFQQLSATFQLIRQKVYLRLPLETEPLAETINYMKSLEGVAPAEKLLRRFYHCQIHKRRQELQKSYSKEVTLDRMLQEAYPGRPLPKDRKADKKRRELKNQLFAARNWILMQETLGEASIALIPSQGKAQIWNQRDRVANMPEAIFKAFLQRLKTKYGSLIESMCSKLGPHLMPILRGVDRTTRFKFEQLSEDVLDTWLHDASRIEDLFSLTENHKD